MNTNPTADRDRIAEALYAHSHPGWATRYTDLDRDERDTYLARASAVLAVLPPAADRAAVLLEAEDDEGDELVCVDMCGSCDACGMEPFGTPAEGWREAARFLRRTARDSGDRQGALHGARLIEAELRRVADEAQQQPDTETPTPNPSPQPPASTALRIRVLREILARIDGSSDGDSATEETGAPTVRAVLAEILADMQPASGLGGVADENPAETPCTCGVAGDAFVPLGHYADCPQAAAPAVVAQPGKGT